MISWDDLYKVAGAAVALGGIMWRVSATHAALRQELADFKLKVAQEYVSANAMREIAGQLGDQISRLGDRLDRVLEKNS